MDELDRLLARAADRGTTRGAEAVWAASVALLERDGATAGSPVEVAPTGLELSAVDDVASRPDATAPGHPIAAIGDVPLATVRPRRAARLLAVAATLALLVAGAGERWSSLRTGTDGTTVSDTVDSTGPTPSTTVGSTTVGASSTTPATTATAATPPTTIAVDDPTATALAQAPHYLPTWLPDGYRLWDLAAERFGGGRYGLHATAVGPGGASVDTAYRHLLVTVLPAVDDPMPLDGAEPITVGGRAGRYLQDQANTQWLLVDLADGLRLTVMNVGGPVTKDDLVRVASSVGPADTAAFAGAEQAITNWISATPIVRTGSVGGVNVELHQGIPEAAGPSAICVEGALVVHTCRSVLNDQIGVAFGGYSNGLLQLPFEVLPGTTTVFGRVRGVHELLADHDVPLAVDHDGDGTWFRVDVAATTPGYGVAVSVTDPQDGYNGFIVVNGHYRPGAGDTLASAGGSQPAVSPRIGVFGDSTAMLLAYGLQGWAVGVGASVDSDGARLGCGLVLPRMVRIAQYGEGPGYAECDWTKRWPGVLDAHPIDVAVVSAGPWDLADMTFDDDPEWHHLGDPVADAHFRRAVQDAVALLAGRGVKVAFVLAPRVDFGRADSPPPTVPYPVSDPARVDRMNAILREVAAVDRRLTLLDLPGYLAGHFPGGEMDAMARPDGVHLSKESAAAVGADWLGPELLRLTGESSWPDTAPNGTPRMAFFGDSTALMTGIGAQVWGLGGGRAVVSGKAQLGCPLVTAGQVELPGLDGALERQPVPAGCDWSTLWPAFLADRRVDLVVVQFGPFDVADHLLPGDDIWRRVGDPRYDDVVRRAARDAAAVFTSRGIHVAWLAAPHVTLSPRVPPVELPASDPARIDRFNALVREALAGDPMVTVLDLPAYLASLPGGEMDAILRPDHVHFTTEGATTVATDWLGPELLKLVPAR